MIGIYKITNLLDGRVYIGQSRDIEERFLEHKYHKKSLIDQAMHDLGDNNFRLDVLEECSVEELDQKELYYINLYESYNPSKGYNVKSTLFTYNFGEANPNVKLTAQDVFDIREAYKNGEHQRDVYRRYSDKIRFSTFLNLWNGNYWTDVHMDAYTPEAVKFQKECKAVRKAQSPFIMCLTDEQVMSLRCRYITETSTDIFDSLKGLMSLSEVKLLLNGYSYKHLPYYSKKENKWLYRK